MTEGSFMCTSARSDRKLPSASIKDPKGCVDVVPSLASGEHKELGNVLHPGLVPLFNELRSEWERTHKTDKRWKDNQVHISPQHLIQLRELSDDAEIGKKVVDNVLKILGLDREPRRKLPQDVPIDGVARGRVPESDQREGLRGQDCLLAAKDLEPGHVVSVYRGYVSNGDVHDALVTEPPACWGSRLSSEWEMLVESYCFADPENGYEVPAEVPKAKVKGSKQKVGATKKMIGIFCNSVGYGNLCGLANDPKLNPIPPDDHTIAQEIQDGTWYQSRPSVKPGNRCTIVPVIVRGWPFPFQVILSPVKSGEELLYEYGAGYWNHFRQCERRARKQAEEMSSRISGLSCSQQITCPSAPSVSGDPHGKDHHHISRPPGNREALPHQQLVDMTHHQDLLASRPASNLKATYVFGRGASKVQPSASESVTSPAKNKGAYTHAPPHTSNGQKGLNAEEGFGEAGGKGGREKRRQAVYERDFTLDDDTSEVQSTLRVIPDEKASGQLALKCQAGGPDMYEESSDDEVTIRQNDDDRNLGHYRHHYSSSGSAGDAEEDEDAEERQRQLEEARLTRYLLQLERLVVTLLGRQKPGRKMTISSILRELKAEFQTRGVFIASVQPGPFMMRRSSKMEDADTNKNMLFKEWIVGPERQVAFTLQPGAANLVCEHYKRAFYVHLEEYKKRIIQYMHVKNRPRVYISELQDSSVSFLEIGLFMKMYPKLVNCDKEGRTLDLKDPGFIKWLLQPFTHLGDSTLESKFQPTFKFNTYENKGEKSMPSQVLELEMNTAILRASEVEERAETAFTAYRPLLCQQFLIIGGKCYAGKVCPCTHEVTVLEQMILRENNGKDNKRCYEGNCRESSKRSAHEQQKD
ncbi:hypothetical protein CEUSTIGMA_g5326.t1 [Chlamydomonas eustigma]|uniref:SET domain-containing protein n=1 Tax=Chlamydomonas eustigma TaxID=1157962 RepID=A0A250X478_9CHLO|nr:hypothetical protein CEUSTIGMA_g5326.t1 [Chlamydomonas eustigma]|eukprot:GAX77884.1 hypothetical protein CEUSTIGMA_g5326.t1 [Chlamydomonas eustigma]